MTESKINLPCLESIGPWWSDRDRRMLLSYLGNIFPFDPSLLAEHSCCHSEDPGIYITADDISNEIDALKNSAKTISCPKVRTADFSFGKFNQKVCYLCPYSKTYKNERMLFEHRFLYYLFTSDKISDSYLSDRKPEEIFRSYFPVYAGNTLVEAYPFSIVMEKYQVNKEVMTSLNPDDKKIFLIEQVTPLMENRIQYIRIKNHLEKFIPSYRKDIVSSLSPLLERVFTDNQNTRACNALLLKRLFNILNEKKDYIVKSPDLYFMSDEGFTDSVHTMQEIEELSQVTDDSDVGGNDKESERQPAAAEGHPIPVKIDANGEPPESFDPSSIFTQLDGIPSLGDSEADRFMLLPEDIFAEDAGVIEKTPFSIVTSGEYVPGEDIDDPDDEEDGDCPSFPPACSVPESKGIIFDKFEYFYNIDSAEGIHVYGKSGIEYDSAVLDAFLEDSDYLSMEPVLLEGDEGILICNKEHMLLFYPIQHYGPRPLRKIADLNIPVYTASIYHLSRYLHRNKIFRLTIKDVGLALSFYSSQAIKGMSHAFASPFPLCMTQYKEAHDMSIRAIPEEDWGLWDCLEEFYRLMASDGNHSPLVGLKECFHLSDSLNYEFMYNKDAKFLCPGVLIKMKATADEESLSVMRLIHCYMDLCLEFSRKVSFAPAKYYILKIDNDGLLIFLTGTERELMKNRLYLSACARKVFLKTTSGKNSIVIEEKISTISLTKKSEGGES